MISLALYVLNTQVWWQYAAFKPQSSMAAFQKQLYAENQGV